jgi:hypothetical protein
MAPDHRDLMQLPMGDAPERVLFDTLADRWPEVGTRVGRSASQVADACEKAMTRATSALEIVDAIRIKLGAT